MPKSLKKLHDIDVLYTDNHLLVVNKPAGMLSQGDKTGDDDLLSLSKQLIKNNCRKQGNVYLGLVHRLDRPASGVMVLARTSKAAARLSSQFRQSTPLKKYIAVVEGRCSGSGVLTDYITKSRPGPAIVDASHPAARFAELSWASIAHNAGLSLLDITLKTGRPHQIRLQLSRAGFPLCGDLRHGARRIFDGRNLALHCYLLGLEHPVQKTFMQWKAPPPQSWQGFFDSAVSRLIL